MSLITTNKNDKTIFESIKSYEFDKAKSNLQKKKLLNQLLLKLNKFSLT